MFTILYIDPGTGSMLISSLVAIITIVFFSLKEHIYNLFSKKGEKGDYFDINIKYNLIYYSEGKQYWNVFKPLLEEGSKRSINSIYLTSDKADPGLQCKIDGVSTFYIGNGKEAYYKLNKLKANVVVMTTPGLDVLEIKRSKDVKHYCHITHATSSSGTYKSFSTDYFDSVLVGGEGTHDLIRELEEYRQLPPKKIKIIGHTYLDVYRENLKTKKYEYTIFKKKRPTILISPTWGNHGLLTKYGDELLSILCNDKNYNIIVRPHPQSFISDKTTINNLMKKYPDQENLIWNTDRENLKAMSHADIMISDFSGIIFDYYTLFKKPILTITSQYEKRGREAMDLKDDPWDLKILNKIGKTIDNNNFKNILQIIDDTLKNYKLKQSESLDLKNLIDKYPNKAAKRGIDFISKILDKQAAQLNIINEDKKDNIFSSNFVLKTPNLKTFIQALIKPEFLFQAVMAGVMFLVYGFLGIHFLPKPGLNVEFLTVFKPYLIFATFIVFVIFLISIWFINKESMNFIKKKEKFEFKDLGLVMLLLSPIMQYVVANQDILKFKDSLIVLGFFILISVILLFIIPTIMSAFISKVFTIPVTLSFTYIIFNMASFGRVSSYKKIGIILSIILLLSFLFMIFNKKKTLVMLALVFFIVNTFASIINLDIKPNSKDAAEEFSFFEIFKDKKVKHKPDIYLLIYDSYPNEETLKSYGINNSKQTEDLLNKGFAIYDGTYSIGAASLISMAPLLNIKPIPNHSSLNVYREKVAGTAEGLSMFKTLGYDTHLLVNDDYLVKGFEPQYTSSFPPASLSNSSYNIITRSILEGEFRFDVEFSRSTQNDFLKAKSKVLSHKQQKPKFVYHHSYNPGHSQNSGVLLPNETELFIERLKLANEEISTDLKDLEKGSTDAIIIIAGDHGPYLTKNGISLSPDYDLSEVTRLDIQDRYGTFLAILWPDENYYLEHKIDTIQDVLPAVFSYMYEDEKIFELLKMSNKVEPSAAVSFAGIDNGIIIGGIDDKKPLFKQTGIRIKSSQN